MTPEEDLNELKEFWKPETFRDQDFYDDRPGLLPDTKGYNKGMNVTPTGNSRQPDPSPSGGPFGLAAALVVAILESALVAFVLSIVTKAAHTASADFPVLGFEPVFGVVALVLVLLAIAGRRYPVL